MCGDSTVTLRQSAYRAHSSDKVAGFSCGVDLELGLGLRVDGGSCELILVMYVAEQMKGLRWILDVASELKEVLVFGAHSQ